MLALAGCGMCLTIRSFQLSLWPESGDLRRSLIQGYGRLGPQVLMLPAIMPAN